MAAPEHRAPIKADKLTQYENSTDQFNPLDSLTAAAEKSHMTGLERSAAGAIAAGGQA
jgi:hypothetical protein